jgi:hypothetical protein
MKPVSLLESVTFAAGTLAPAGSLTMPLKTAVAGWAQT